jgi:hypothetical protein
VSGRPNWRDLPVTELTDDEVAAMSDLEQRWCLDLLCERQKLLTTELAELATASSPVPLDIDAASIAIMASGIRIRIYPGEGFSAECFAGEIINPTEQQMRGHGHVSCCWDRSKVVALERAA